jgi:hypothetical protein
MRQKVAKGAKNQISEVGSPGQLANRIQRRVASSFFIHPAFYRRFRPCWRPPQFPQLPIGRQTR